MSQRPRVVRSLVFINLSVFVAVVAFLPAGHIRGDNPISWSINALIARERWDIAWLALLASVLVSVGVYFLLSPRAGPPNGKSTGPST